MKITFKWADSTPKSEFSQSFIQGMLDRIGVSFHKYGKAADAFPHRVDALKSLKARIKMYRKTGNTEWLMDVANFAMFEYMHPSHKRAHFRPTDSSESPGCYRYGELDPSSRRNLEP